MFFQFRILHKLREFFYQIFFSFFYLSNQINLLLTNCDKIIIFSYSLALTRVRWVLEGKLLIICQTLSHLNADPSSKLPTSNLIEIHVMSSFYLKKILLITINYDIIKYSCCIIII